MAFLEARGLRRVLAQAGLLAGAGAIGALAFYLAFLRDLPDLQHVDDYRPPLSSRVYDRHGALIGEFYTERRRLVRLEAVPEHVVQAFVAGEDSSFFEHSGIDYTAILRAAWVNLRAGGEFKQGGSTITQQMVKGLLLSPERKVRRKIREMILARRIEERFTKQEILFLYLHQIYFGRGAYGLGEAAQTYYGKDVAELTLSEAAQLAGLPKAPSRYSPLSNPEEAERRRLYVLERMLEEELIDERTHAEAVATVPVLVSSRNLDDFEAAAYFTEQVRRYLFDRLGSDLVLRGGLEIHTSVEIGAQRAAVDALRKGLTDLDRRQGYRKPARRVAADEIPAELERLAEENGLAPPAKEPDEEAEERDESQLAEAGSEEPPELPRDRSLLGVIIAIDPDAQTARVGFAPHAEATVELESVAWAREADPSKAPHPVKKIDRVFQRGDVARFRVLEADEESNAGAAGQDPRVTLDQEPIVQGALLCIDLESDEVLALVGGYDFGRSQFNRVMQARRQPGSAFKPLIYAAALERGYTPASILWDRPVVYVDETSGFIWRPRNYGRSFYGPITLREALVRSVNNATVHLFRDVGVDFVIGYMRRLGIESPLNRDLSLALGSSGVSLLEMTRAYAIYASGGRRVVPRFIRRVVDREGRVLVEDVTLGDSSELDPEAGDEESQLASVAAEGPSNGDRIDPVQPFEGSDLDGERVIDTEQAYLVTDLLRAVVTDPKGTGWRAKALGRPVAGKTGTTNDQGDAWFMGFAPQIITGVWVGHDESRFLGWGETGSRAAAPIWVDFMREVLKSRPVREFPTPESIVFARVDRKTGLLADAASTDTVFQSFVAGTEPTESARSAQTDSQGRRLLRLDSF